jgi:hypothetical protein
LSEESCSRGNVAGDTECKLQLVRAWACAPDAQENEGRYKRDAAKAMHWDARIDDVPRCVYAEPYCARRVKYAATVHYLQSDLLNRVRLRFGQSAECLCAQICHGPSCD